MSLPADVDWDAELDRLMQSMARLQADPTTGELALGAREWDWQLYRLGRHWLDRVAAISSTGTAVPPPRRRPRDVYLATQVYEIGGHTGLIGDCVRALEDADAHVIITDLSGLNTTPLSDLMLMRMAVARDEVTVLPGPRAGERLQQLFAAMTRLRPDRLFLFQHPHDPLASVVAQPEVAPRRILVHHADATPSFGLHVPGVTIVDLNPSALATTRLIGRESVLLPLTAPDPGPRPPGFLRRERLVTASCGSAHKFRGDYVFGYPETVGLILQTTRGWHLHIGPLEDATLAEVASSLRRRQVPADRFLHVPSTSSVAATLWEHGCDLYCASFPVDGARTKVEVLGSGTPYLFHARSPTAAGALPLVDAEGLCVWRTWEDLADTLQRLSNAATLEAHASFARTLYERVHHPRVFQRRLRAIVEGSAASDTVDVASTLSAMQTALLRSPDARLAAREAAGVIVSLQRELRAEVDRHAALLRDASTAEQQALQTQLDVLRAQVAELRDRLAELRQEHETWKAGRGLRAGFRRWLTRT